ncbi:ABC transporter permease, partial [Roseomonas mucosa]
MSASAFPERAALAGSAPSAGTLALAWRLARRELRGGVKGLRIVLACLALGVAAIAAVGTLRAAVETGLAADGARLLGGDLEVRASQRPMPEEGRRWLEAQGARVSEVVSMRAMAVAPRDEGGGVAPTGPDTEPRSGFDRSLVELKAVDGTYPLYGTLELDPPGPLGDRPDAEGRWPLALDRLVLDRLGMRVGDTVRIGEARFVLRGTVASEPDKVASAFQFGPRAIVPLAALPATELIQPGSLVTYAYRLRLPPGTEEARFTAALRAQGFADSGWRIRDASDGAPGVGRFVDNAASFLTLAGLTALLVGGIGVA